MVRIPKAGRRVFLSDSFILSENASNEYILINCHNELLYHENSVTYLKIYKIIILSIYFHLSVIYYTFIVHQQQFMSTKKHSELPGKNIIYMNIPVNTMLYVT